MRLIGADTVVPCLDGRPRRYVNLDDAASTPVMAAVWDAVEAFVPWYQHMTDLDEYPPSRAASRSRRRRRLDGEHAADT